MRFWLWFIVLGFPALDLYTTVALARWSGSPAWIWIACSMVLGWLLLRNERITFREKTIAAMHGEHPLLRGLLDSGRKVLAGVLLMAPGILSDIIAIILLLFPINLGGNYIPQAVRSRHGETRTLPGDYRRLE